MIMKNLFPFFEGDAKVVILLLPAKLFETFIISFSFEKALFLFGTAKVRPNALGSK